MVGDAAFFEGAVDVDACLFKLFLGDELGEAAVHELVEISAEGLRRFSVLLLEGEDVNCLFGKRRNRSCNHHGYWLIGSNREKL